MFEKMLLIIIVIMQFLTLCHSYNNMVLAEDIHKILAAKEQINWSQFSTTDNLPNYFDHGNSDNSYFGE